MNRRDFLKGMGIGVAAAGVATVVRESQPLPVPEFKNLKELDPILRYLEDAGPLPDVELVRKFVGFAAALPDNPAALVPVYLLIRKIIHKSQATSKFKVKLINSPEFIAVFEKHGHWLE